MYARPMEIAVDTPTSIPMNIPMENIIMDNLAVLQMIQVCDSLFPIGTFTLSNGLETFVCEEKVKSEQNLITYLESYMQILPYNELGTMLLAFRHGDDREYIQELDQYSMALKLAMEVRRGTQKLCRRFLKTFAKIAEYPLLSQYESWIGEGLCMGNHAVAVGLYAKEIQLEEETAAAIYVYSLLSSIVTNTVKAVPLSQIGGQRILNQCLKQVNRCIRETQKIEMEDLGVGGTEFEIEAMNHEILYSRLYMS